MTVRKMELRPRQPHVHVAAYIRVNSALEKQLDSLENQREHYEALISSNPSWEPAGLFIDKGISKWHGEEGPPRPSVPHGPMQGGEDPTDPDKVHLPLCEKYDGMSGDGTGAFRSRRHNRF